MICPICNHPTSPAHMEAHFLRGEAAKRTTKDNTVEYYQVAPAILNAQTGATSVTCDNAEWLQDACQQSAMEWFLAL